MLGVEISERADIGVLMKLFKKNRLVVDQFLFHEKAFRIAPPLIISDEETTAAIQLIVKSLDELNLKS